MALGSAAVALANPRRADMVALFGDLTSSPVLPRLVRRINRSPQGYQMLQTLQPSRFPSDGLASLQQFRTLPDGTLGREYVRFMDRRRFTPQSRHPVRFVNDPTHKWILQRYRDVHDLWHVLNAMPTTFLGELTQKYFEAAHTGLPIAIFSAAFGPIRLSCHDRQLLTTQLIPWAIQNAYQAHDLLAIRYEDFLDVPLDQLRRQWRLTPSDIPMKGRQDMP